MLSTHQAFASPPRHLFRLVPCPFACTLRKCLLGSWGKGAKGQISDSILSLCCPPPNLTHAPREPPSKPGQRHTAMEAAFPCHQSFGPCTENCLHPQGSPSTSSLQTTQLQELQRLRTARETHLGRRGPHRSPTFSVQGVVRDPWGFATIFICKQMSLPDGISGDVHLAPGM